MATREDAPVPAFTYAPEVAERTSPSGFLLDALRRRRFGRALVSGLTVLLFLAGSGLFAYPFFTDLYTDQVLQGRLSDEFDRIVAADDWGAAEVGSPLTRIVIPALEVTTVVVSGTSPAALRAGAGHYPSTPLPGEVGNVGIAGHRTTYGRPFNRLDELAEGDEIWLLTPVGDHRYVVSEPPTAGDCQAYAGGQGAPDDTAACVTHPMDWTVVDPAADEALLTLTTCHPKGSAQQRLIIRATLDESFDPGSYEDGRVQATSGERGPATFGSAA